MAAVVCPRVFTGSMMMMIIKHRHRLGWEVDYRDFFREDVSVLTGNSRENWSRVMKTVLEITAGK